jgi:hypothetical protein
MPFFPDAQGQPHKGPAPSPETLADDFWILNVGSMLTQIIFRQETIRFLLLLGSFCDYSYTVSNLPLLNRIMES